MVRCFGVWHGCVRVLGVPIACPVTMIVVRRQLQQYIVARIRVWRYMTGDGIGYDFEHTICGRPPCILASLWSTRATGTLGRRTLSAVSVHMIHYRRLRQHGFAVLNPFSGVYSTCFMTRRTCLCLLLSFATTVGSDDDIRLGDVRARLPLPRPSDSLLQRLAHLLTLHGSSFGRTYSPSDTTEIRDQFMCTVRTYSDTNATRYPQFQNCIHTVSYTHLTLPTIYSV